MSREAWGDPPEEDLREEALYAADREADAIAARINASMRTVEDALRWALLRIANSGLGQGEYFERATNLLVSADAKPAPPQAVAVVRRSGPGGMASITPLVPPEHLEHGMRLYSEAAPPPDWRLAAARFLRARAEDRADLGWANRINELESAAALLEQLQAASPFGLDCVGAGGTPPSETATQGGLKP